MTPDRTDTMRDETLMAVLRKHASPDGDRWRFASSLVTHSEEDALRIVEACQALGTPVTDVVTTTAWWTLVSRVAELDKRVRELEARDRGER
ncbi:hypothetical protein [Planobispora rosea]|uniref:hypothetical protein n=1 Tax=Planobispora rosea TaxID=35762 RepID=UPI00083A13A2|nr:hypothetical protein [Planobispora rosea]